MGEGIESWLIIIILVLLSSRAPPSFSGHEVRPSNNYDYVSSVRVVLPAVSFDTLYRVLHYPSPAAGADAYLGLHPGRGWLRGLHLWGVVSTPALSVAIEHRENC